MGFDSRRSGPVWFVALLSPGTVFGQQACPPLEVVVDNDLPRSGYREEQAENWESRGVAGCNGTYRYLSRYVGDGSRRGRAIWQPAIAEEGFYAVEVSYRATENRTTDAKYVLIDDMGGRREHHENQAHAGDCTRVDLGEIFCRVGGECRVMLDGDDGQSASADETIFRRERCDGPAQPPPPLPRPCDGIRNLGMEVCEEEEGRCAGIFSQGQGCAVYCGAAGMRCAEHLGGEPGCMPEAANVHSCDVETGNRSDWCACEGEAPPSPDVPVMPPTLPPALADAMPAEDDVVGPSDGGGQASGDGGQASDDAGQASDIGFRPIADLSIPGPDLGEDRSESDSERPRGNAACHLSPPAGPSPTPWLLVPFLLLLGRRRPRLDGRTTPAQSANRPLR